MKTYLIILAGFIFGGCNILQTTKPPATALESEAEILLQKADNFIAKNQPSLALHFYQEAYEKFTLNDNIDGKARSLGTLVKVYHKIGEREHALSTLQRLDTLTEVYPQLRPQWKKASAYIHFAESNFDQLKNLSAVKTLTGDVETEVILGAYLLISGQPAVESALQAKKLKMLLEGAKPSDYIDPLVPGFGYYSLGLYEANNKLYVAAFEDVSKALSLDRSLSHSPGIAQDLVLLGDLFRATGKHLEAVDHYVRAAEIFKLIDDSSGVTNAWVKENISRVMGFNSTAAKQNLRNIPKEKIPIDLREAVADLIR